MPGPMFYPELHNFIVTNELDLNRSVQKHEGNFSGATFDKQFIKIDLAVEMWLEILFLSNAAKP